MIALYSEDDLLVGDVAQVLPDVHLHHTRCRAEFAGFLRMATCALVALPDLGDPRARHWFRDTASHCSHLEWILLTHATPGNALHLRELPSGVHIVWLNEVKHRLASLIREFSGTDLLDCVVRLVRDAPGAPAEVVRALEGIAESVRPPVTVGGLARMSGMTEDCLRYRWGRAVGPEVSLKELVDWLVLGCCLRRKPALGSWERVAGEVGIKEETLQALCLRRASVTPGGLERLGRAKLRSGLAEWWRRKRAG